MKAIISVIVLSFLFLPVMVTTAAAELINTPEGVIITHYPAKFDRTGTIDRVGEKGIVVNDTYLSFAAHVIFMTPQSEYSYLRSFKSGQKVGYLLNSENQITKLCLFLGSGK